MIIQTCVAVLNAQKKMHTFLESSNMYSFPANQDSDSPYYQKLFSIFPNTKHYQRTFIKAIRTLESSATDAQYAYTEDSSTREVLAEWTE